MDHDSQAAQRERGDDQPESAHVGAGCRRMSCGVARRDMMEKRVGQLVEVRRPRGRQ